MSRQLKVFCCLFVLLLLQSSKAVNTNRIYISVSKATVLIFSDPIDEIELGSSEYASKIKGNFLLIRAKKLNAKPTFLFVRYGNGKNFQNLEICASNNAPMEYNMSDFVEKGSTSAKSKTSKKDSRPQEKQIRFMLNSKQKYFTYSKQEHGTQLTLLDIEHFDGNTYLKFNIKNKSSIDLDMQHISFNYYDIDKYLFLFSKRVRNKLVEPVIPPENVKVNASESKDFVFCIPTVKASGGLEVYFEEAEASKALSINIPHRVLLNAKRRL